ncbi:MAG: phospholipase D-like domain-containing protein [Firmicutes bacterium]|nr:phospholipase D-like domain-containing protein [Bacillota bacterium]
MKIEHTPSYDPISIDKNISPVKAPSAKPSPSVPQEKADAASIKDTVETSAKTPPPPQVIVLKEGGVKALVDSINEAKKTIDLKIYMILPNPVEITDALKKAVSRGVKVRLMVENDPFYWQKDHPNPSKKEIDDLVKAGVEYKADNPEFSKNSVTHEKSMTIDGKKSLILTGNITASAFSTNLDMGAIILQNPEVVKQVETVFNSDWDRTKLPPLKDTGLVVSPQNAREKITELVQKADKSIHIIQQTLTDKELLTIIADKLKDGVETELLMTDPTVVQNNMQSAAYLATHGAKVKFLETPYIHAKAITIDVDDKKSADRKSFVGSQNFTSAAIDKNRELGYIFNDKSGQIEHIFDEYMPEGYDIPSKMVITDAGSVGSSINSAIRLAEKSIFIETNLFSDTATISSLLSAAKRGLDVKVMMPKNPFPWDPKFDMNIKTAEQLKAGGVDVKFTDSTIKAVEGSMLLVDGKEAALASDNLSKSSFSRNLTYGVLDIEPKEVNDIKNILDADWKGSTPASKLAKLGDGDIIASPNSREKIAELLKEAKSSINIETVELSDAYLAAILKNKAKSGIPVKIMVADKPSMPQWQKDVLKSLQDAGARVELLSYTPLKTTYINSDDKKAFIGGTELSKDSLDNTRSFGLIATSPQMIKIANQSFDEQLMTASMDQVSKEAYLEKKALKYPDDRTMVDILEDRAKYGVRVKLAVGNQTYGYIDVEAAGLNKKLKEIAKLDPKKDIEEIASFYDMKFNQAGAVEAQKKLKEALKNLKPGENLFEVDYKDPATIKEDYLQVDDRKIPLPARTNAPNDAPKPLPETKKLLSIDWNISSK